jgi:hypothetical protein
MPWLSSSSYGVVLSFRYSSIHFADSDMDMVIRGPQTSILYFRMTTPFWGDFPLFSFAFLCARSSGLCSTSVFVATLFL